MKHFPLTIIFICTSFSAISQNSFFSEIDIKTYNKYKLIDTLFRKGSFLVTTKNKPSGLNSMSEFVEVEWGDHKRYFLLGYDVHFVNDTTIYAFGPAYKVTADDKGFMKNGLWVYTEFLTKRNVLTNELISYGKKFVVDSIPNNWDNKRLPTKEGIYFYQENKLVQISTEQSEKAFDLYGRTGFYFFPNTGRLFTKHSIREIK